MFYNIEKFVDLVQQRPILYNTELKDHRNQNICEKLWKEVGEELDINVNECRRKWRLLRSSYLRYIKKLEESPFCQRSKKKKKIWYLAERMEFVRKYLTYPAKKINDESNTAPLNFDESSSTTLSTWETPIEDNPTKDYDDDNSMGSLDSMSSIIEISDTEEPETDIINDGLETSNESHNVLVYQKYELREPDCSPETSERTSQQHKNFDWPASKPKETSQPEKNVTTYMKSKEIEEDEIVTFFKGILPEIDALSEKNLRLFKQEILLILNKSLDEQETKVND